MPLLFPIARLKFCPRFSPSRWDFSFGVCFFFCDMPHPFSLFHSSGTRRFGASSAPQQPESSCTFRVVFSREVFMFPLTAGFYFKLIFFSFGGKPFSIPFLIAVGLEVVFFGFVGGLWFFFFFWGCCVLSVAGSLMLASSSCAFHRVPPLPRSAPSDRPVPCLPSFEPPASRDFAPESSPLGRWSLGTCTFRLASCCFFYFPAVFPCDPLRRSSEGRSAASPPFFSFPLRIFKHYLSGFVPVFCQFLSRILPCSHLKYLRFLDFTLSLWFVLLTRLVCPSPLPAPHLYFES